MSDIFAGVRDLTLITIIYRIVLAFLIGGLIGFERGKHGRAAGLRTHILVCVASALSSLLGLYIESISPVGVVDPTRIAAQVIASLGVIGAGSILIKNRDIITGLTTSAGMWSTGIIGLAIGFGFYEGALICALLTIIAMSVLNYFELSKKNELRIYVEIDDANKTNDIIDKLLTIDKTLTLTYIGPSKTMINGHVGVYIKSYVALKDDVKKVGDDILEQILKVNHVVLAIKE